MSEKKQQKKTHSYPPVFLTVWQDAWTALTQPRQYIRWAFQPFSRSVKYLAFLHAVLAIVATAYFFITLKPAILSLQDWFEETIPVMTWKDGQLSVENDETVTFTDSDEIFLKVDSSQRLEDNPHIDSFYAFGVLMTRDALLLKDEAETEIIPWSEAGLKDFMLSGTILSQWIDQLMKWAIVLVPVAVFLYLMIARLAFTAFFSVILYLVDGMRFSFTHFWSMAIYATTPAILAGYIGFVFAVPAGLFTAAFLAYFIFAYFNYLKFKLPKQTLKG